jgi:uncharacterized protein YbaR (Trm112 family)
MISIPLTDALLKILRCPESRQALRLATDDELSTLNRGRECPVDTALIREDRQKAYPIQDGFPILLVDQAIEIDPDLLKGE